MSANFNHPPDPSSRRTVVSVGNFDGVHRGHQALVREARGMAGADGRVVLLVFDPHPATVLKSTDAAPARLTTFKERKELLHAVGADTVVQLEPTLELLGRSPREFAVWLQADYGMTGIVEGPDFRFGKDRAGDMTLLGTLGEELGFSVQILNPIEIGLDDQTLVRASSTMARWLLGHGRVRDVRSLLGRSHRIAGVVVEGAGRGRKIGIPTANVETSGVLPADGVYAGRARVISGADDRAADGGWHTAAINIGTRPTFGEEQNETCEVHLLEFRGAVGDYGWNIEVEFDKYLRDEMKFDSVAAVVAQIRRDIAKIEGLVLNMQQST